MLASREATQSTMDAEGHLPRMIQNSGLLNFIGSAEYGGSSFLVSMGHPNLSFSFIGHPPFIGATLAQ